MKAKFIFESPLLEGDSFRRGVRDPKQSIGVGKYRHQYLRNALEDNPYESDFFEWIAAWFEENPNLVRELDIDPLDPFEFKSILGFEVDSYLESLDGEIEPEDFSDEFIVKKIISPSEPGELTLKVGELIPDGSKVIYYFGGLTDGYITKKEWLK
jgi:hypothetical protein